MEICGQACYTLKNRLGGTQVATVELSFDAINSYYKMLATRAVMISSRWVHGSLPYFDEFVPVPEPT